MSLFSRGVSLPILRSLPLAFFLVAVPLTYAGGRRAGGPLCGLISGLLFATSPVAAGFALQIRGYGPSWFFFALALWCAMESLRSPSWAWRFGYALAAAAAVAVLPSNLFLALALAAGVVAGGMATTASDHPWLARTAIWLLATPLLGLTAYVAIRHDLLRFAAMDLSPWTRTGLLREWLHAPLADVEWFWVPVAAGAVAGAIALVVRGRAEAAALSSGVAVCLAIMVAFIAILLLAPKVPFARSLVPFLPVWYCVLACLACFALERLLALNAVPALVLGAAPVALLLAATPPHASCRVPDAAASVDGYDLCYQYFHDRYHPDAIVEAWRLLGDPGLELASDYEAFYALRVLGVPGLRVYEYRSIPAGRAPAIVAAHPGDLERIAGTMGLQPGAYRLVADTGYFKLYALPSR
jgi:hypothetical protein